MAPEAEKTQKMANIFKKLEKIWKFCQKKNAKTCNVETSKPFYYH